MTELTNPIRKKRIKKYKKLFPINKDERMTQEQEQEKARQGTQVKTPPVTFGYIALFCTVMFLPKSPFALFLLFARCCSDQETEPIGGSQ